MNAVEIEEAVSALAENPFDASEFPFSFLLAFGNKPTTIKKLRNRNSNKSDVGGVLQNKNVHIKACECDHVSETLIDLEKSPATTKHKVQFILATDGNVVQAKQLSSGDIRIFSFTDLPDNFGFFLPLAGISTVKEICENAFDIRATARLNTLYVELRKRNPDWDADINREKMNLFMARLIFCFFADDTEIFSKPGLFIHTTLEMSSSSGEDLHEVVEKIFRSMNTPTADRAKRKIPRWAQTFPYVNGQLFSGDTSVPHFSRIARSYLEHIGKLDWKRVNPDIFGSMIQAVAEDDERASLGMHYTSVPNILKVLNPLFLDDLRDRLEQAKDSKQKLLNLRKRMSKIRVFDPACGSGNFLVIAYKEMRAIEAEINKRRGESIKLSQILKTNFRGIELRTFSATIARLALIIAEFQCDVLYLGQKEALREILPLETQNWITSGNSLRIDWNGICPPSGKTVAHRSDGILDVPVKQSKIEFENEGGEVYICGNPPYLGSLKLSDEQKEDIKLLFKHRTTSYRKLDYVAGWFIKAANFLSQNSACAAFVTTNSICQGQQLPVLWPLIYELELDILFAYTSFIWKNLAKDNAGVTVAIVAITGYNDVRPRHIYSVQSDGETIQRRVKKIGPKLEAVGSVKLPVVTPVKSAPPNRSTMVFGNMPIDGGHLLMSAAELQEMSLTEAQKRSFVKRLIGSKEFIRGTLRYCLWINDDKVTEAQDIPQIMGRLDRVRIFRENRNESDDLSSKPHRFASVRQVGNEHLIVIPGVSSEKREFLPVGIAPLGSIASNLCFAMLDAPLYNLAIIASRLHLAWIRSVCGKLTTRLRYSNTLGWNTFPFPVFTDKHKDDLTKSAENILLARELYYPATIAELYDPDRMPPDLREAHEHNDDILERIYIGRRFKNDTERLEKLFELYSEVNPQ